MRNRVYFEEDNAKILYADTLTTKLIEDESIDLIVTSPPYNLDINYKSHNDAQPYDEYLKFTKTWLKRCLRWQTALYGRSDTLLHRSLLRSYFSDGLSGAI